MEDKILKCSNCGTTEDVKVITGNTDTSIDTALCNQCILLTLTMKDTHDVQN